MQLSARRSPVVLVGLAVVALVAGACSGGAGSTTPSPTPGAAQVRLRLTTTQAIAPIERFAWQAAVAITADGVVVQPGAVPAIYPGPLVTPLFGRTISDAGWARIVDLARSWELLVDGASFAGDAAMPGAQLGQVEIVADGRSYTITGDPNAQIQCITTPCDPPPGTPPAFGEFWRRVSDLPSWLASELGPESEYLPSAYGLLVGPPPVAEAGIRPQLMDWPLEAPLASLGAPVPNTGYRCAVVAGDDAATLRPALRAANVLTQWVQDPDTSATFGLTVRPLLPGEQPCAELFGLE